jgi:hypothetical protein
MARTRTYICVGLVLTFTCVDKKGGTGTHECHGIRDLFREDGVPRHASFAGEFVMAIAGLEGGDMLSRKTSLDVRLQVGDEFVGGEEEGVRWVGLGGW